MKDPGGFVHSLGWHLQVEVQADVPVAVVQNDPEAVVHLNALTQVEAKGVLETERDNNEPMRNVSHSATADITDFVTIPHIVTVAELLPRSSFGDFRIFVVPNQGKHAAPIDTVFFFF